MAYYMFQGTYTAAAWKSLLDKPVDRFDVVKPVITKLGGKPVHSWFALGEHDFVVIAEFPDNPSAAAFSLAAAAGGSVHSVKTTALLTSAEGIETMKKAATAGYRPVGQ